MTCPECGTLVKSVGGVHHCTHCGWADSTELTARVPVIVVGPYGKALGSRVCTAIRESSACMLFAGVTRPNGDTARRSDDLGGAVAAGSFSSLERKVGVAGVQEEGVVLYATQGGKVLSRMQEAIQHGFHRHAIGSTDLPVATVAYLKEMALRGELVLYAPNFSILATYTDWVVEVSAQVLRDYDAGVEERHHRRKAGPISGTALMYAASIARARGLDPDAVIQRGGARPGTERERSDISVSGLRIGGIPGEHEVFFGGDHDMFGLVQRAYSAMSFAVGAIPALVWCARRPLGPQEDDSGRRVHTMRDVMGLPDPAHMSNWK
ncbi:MAG: dihydrodipicolinate reductase C-terminal domain-containing protein [Patescibacteria group bacterium]